MTTFADRIRFEPADGAILDGPVRYLMLRADVMTDLLAGLPAPAFEATCDAFAAAVRVHGRHSLERYLAELERSGQDRTALLHTVVEAAGTLGWGVWALALEPDAITLEVRGSPFSTTNAADLPSCAPIRGMLTALAELIFEREVTCIEHDCEAIHATHACSFSARVND